MSLQDFQGRWDAVIHHPSGDFPSWFEVTGETGQLVGRFGSARPIPVVTATDAGLSFTLPKQYEGRNTDMTLRGSLTDTGLAGEYLSDEGEWIPWSAFAAPLLPAIEAPAFGPAIELVGADLSNWHPRSADHTSNWSIVERGLDNATVGTDLVTNDGFTNFKLIAEYRYPSGSNSGIYLRGRYEFQILDDYGTAPHVGGSGAIYGFLSPTVNAILPPGEWNTAEITLLGRWITVVLNGVTIIDHAEIPGITGGALDVNEGEPGPIFVQGDHGPVTFRRLSLLPVA
jgi:hypothetical protein